MTDAEALEALKKEPTPIEILYDAVAELPRSYKNLDMKKILAPAVNTLPDLLIARHLWQSKYIDYEEPYLMRLYHQIETPSKENSDKINKVRLNLHYFFGKTDELICPYSDLENPYVLHKDRPKQNPDDPQLYHFHSWGAGFFLFEGGYEQQIGYATQFGLEGRPPISKISKHSAEDASRVFVFNSPLIWHRVMPQGDKPVCTLMVSYAPEDWQQKDPPPPALRDLEHHEKIFHAGKVQAVDKKHEFTPRSAIRYFTYCQILSYSSLKDNGGNL